MSSTHLKKFEIRHSDGTAVQTRATNEDMARQFAMEQKYGPASQNRTWSSNVWFGSGLSVTEIINAVE